MRLARFSAALVAAALSFGIATGMPPAHAAGSADGSTVLVQSLDSLWTQDHTLDAQVSDATATLDRLDATVATQGRSTPDSVYVQIAAQEAVVHSLVGQHADVNNQITETKSIIAERGSQVFVAATAQQAAAEQADPRMAQVDAVIATLPYPVRTLGTRIVFGNHPAIGPAWGVYDRNTNTIYLGETAFATETRFRYTVAHEYAHAYEQIMMSAANRQQAFSIVSSASVAAPADELFADTLATIWGAGADSFYWTPPAEVVAQVAPLVR